MHKLRHLVSVVLLSATLLLSGALAQSNLTQIRDTIYNADGTPFNGTVVITWNGYSSTLSGTVSPLSTSARIYNGALSVLLVPTTTAGGNSFYQVVYSSSDGTTQWTETWQVPPSSNALSVAGVRTSSGTTGGGGSGSTGSTGSGTGSTQYATLPIAMSSVTGLSSALNTLTTSVAANTSGITALQSSITGLQTSATTLTNSQTSLQTSFTGLSGTVSGLQTALTALTNTVNSLPSSGGGSGPSGSSAAFVDGDTLTGTMDGSNSIFALANTPSPVASLALYRNGLLQKPGIDFALNGTTVTFTSVAIPKPGDALQAYYRVSGTGSPATFVDDEIPGGTINGTNAAFSIAAAPNPVKSLEVFKNGMLLQAGSDYSISGSTITFMPSVIPQVGDSLSAFYRH